jgi:flagellar basal body-associated protein FliL
MADEAAAAPPAAAEAAPPPKPGPSKLMLPLVVVLATILGGVVGVMVVAPRLIAFRTASAEAQKTEEGAEGGKKEGKEGAERGPVFKIDNLIVNPAGSLVSRFLLVSVAIETKDDKMDESLRRHEALIRDLLIALLERQTMEALGRPGIRDSLKAAIADTVSRLAGSKDRLPVFLPQFVIQ